MGPAVFLICCFLLILMVPVGLFLLTYIFRLACVLCGLPRPSVVVAAGVMLVNFAADAVAERLMVWGVEAAGDALGLPRWECGVVSFFLALPIDLVISAGLHAGLLGIRFGKGIEVWFVQRLIYLCILAAVVFVALIVYLIQAN